MSKRSNTRFCGQSHCATDNHSGLPSAADFFQQIGTPLRQHDDTHYAPCPWTGGWTCPTHGTVKVDRQTGEFHCPLCASNGGDALTYHQLANRLSYVQAVACLTCVEV